MDQLLDHVLGRRSDSDSQDAPPAPGATVSTTGDDGGAIVITVNYMFMDTTFEPMPGRTGLLVVTLPNNPTNREPQIISQFISLATRMAYSALIHNAPKPKPGITLEKFHELESVDLATLEDQTCSICFEQYEEPPIMTSKRRKLSPDLPYVSASATPEAPSYTPNIADDSPVPPAPSVTEEPRRSSRIRSRNQDLNSPSGYTTEAAAPSSDSAQPEQAADGTESTQDEPQIPLLCDHEEEFDHGPLRMPCGHVFGRSCLAQWLKTATNCPLCRVALVEPAPQPSIPPVSYIRFGGLADAAAQALEAEATASTNSEDSTQASASNQTQPSPSSTEGLALNQGLLHSSSQDRSQDNHDGPSLLRRATQVLFNQSSRSRTSAPASPMESDGRQEPRSSRNPSFTPVINNIQNYFRRARRHRDGGSLASLGFFPTGVASRRTANGVETVTSDESAEFFDSSNLMSNSETRDDAPTNTEHSDDSNRGHDT